MPLTFDDVAKVSRSNRQEVHGFSRGSMSVHLPFETGFLGSRSTAVRVTRPRPGSMPGAAFPPLGEEREKCRNLETDLSHGLRTTH